VIKERGRALLNTLPFQQMPQIMLIELIYHVVLWLNAFPSKSGISETLSPRKIVLRHNLDFKRHCRAPFGSYCKAHDEPEPTNNMVLRSTPSIVLGPTGNLQGTYKFFSLVTGKKIKRRRLTRYPMPDSVIKKVEGYARKAGKPNALDFADQSGILFKWNEEIDESPEGLVIDDYVPYPAIPAEFPGVELEWDTPIMETIEEEIIPHGRPEHAAAFNAGIIPHALAGVGRRAIFDAHADKIRYAIDEDEDDGIIAVADLPAADRANALVIDDDDYPHAERDSSEDDDDTDGDSDNKSDTDYDDSDDNDDDSNDDTDDTTGRARTTTPPACGAHDAPTEDGRSDTTTTCSSSTPVERPEEDHDKPPSKMDLCSSLKMISVMPSQSRLRTDWNMPSESSYSNIPLGQDSRSSKNKEKRGSQKN
jgi:hypothetical protein